ncbi:hypothetical protein PMI31_00210, partial [Pseudomonas sp. GM55]
SEHDWVGPKTDSSAIPAFGRDGADQRHRLHYEGDPTAIAQGQPYKIALEDGSLVQGITGTNGLTELLERTDMQLASLEVFRNSSHQAATSGLNSTRADASSPFDLFFLLKDEKTGVPLNGVTYRIKLESGDVVVGVSDEQGRTQIMRSDTSQITTIEVPYHDDRATSFDPLIGSDTCDC